MDSLELESLKEALMCLLLSIIVTVIIFFIAVFVGVGIENLFFKSKEKINTDMNNVTKLHIYIEGGKKIWKNL